MLRASGYYNNNRFNIQSLLVGYGYYCTVIKKSVINCTQHVVLLTLALSGAVIRVLTFHYSDYYSVIPIILQ